MKKIVFIVFFIGLLVKAQTVSKIVIDGVVYEVSAVGSSGSGTGLTTDQLNRHNNLGTEVFDVLTDNYVTVASDFQKTSGADIGKRTVKVHDAATDFTATVTDAILDGQSYQFLNRNANGSITLVPDTGITFNGKTGFNAIASDTTRVAAIRHSATDFELQGAYSWIAQASGNPNLAAPSSATDPDNEANATTGWTTPGASVTIASSTTQFNNGTHSLAITQNAGGTDGTTRVTYIVTAPAAGTYDFSFDAYIPSGVTDVKVAVLNPSNGQTLVSNTNLNGTDSWVTTTKNTGTSGSGTVDGGQDLWIFIDFSDVADNYTTNGNTAQTIYLDNVVFKLE